MTPEQACDVLVRAGVLQKIDSKHNPYAFRFPYGGSWPFSDAEQVINDGNVAMAAWAALFSARPDAELSVDADGACAAIRDADLDPPYQNFWSDGTDSAAITTACAMALRAVEGGDE